MPIIDLKLLEGRTLDEKRRLVASVTEAVVESLGVKPESVRITLHEMPKDNYSVAGILASDSNQ